jgi:hypothetical protein
MRQPLTDGAVRRRGRRAAAARPNQHRRRRRSALPLPARRPLAGARSIVDEQAGPGCRSSWQRRSPAGSITAVVDGGTMALEADSSHDLRRGARAQRISLRSDAAPHQWHSEPSQLHRLPTTSSVGGRAVRVLGTGRRRVTKAADGVPPGGWITHLERRRERLGRWAPPLCARRPRGSLCDGGAAQLLALGRCCGARRPRRWVVASTPPVPISIRAIVAPAPIPASPQSKPALGAAMRRTVAGALTGQP